MQTPKALLHHLIFSLCLLLISCQDVCTQSTNYGFTLGLCKCPTSKVLVNGQCLTCTVSNCLLCAIDNVYECDICAPGYRIDQFTKTQCVKEMDMEVVCTASSCACSAYEIYKDGKCISCSVPNCLLCSVQEPTQCDICHSGYILDQLTKSQCKKQTTSTPTCTEASCLCTPYQLNLNGSCLSCLAANCLLCTLENPNQCDICQKGYVLDAMTGTHCVAAVNSVPNCTIKACLCGALQVEVEGVCQDCGVLNCELCAVGNAMECDICVKGYVLDALTQSKCIKSVDSNLSCIENSCQCSPFQSNINGICMTCQVQNCRLCSYNNPQQCDICSSGYILDALSKSQCVSLNNNQPTNCSSLGNSCACSPYQISTPTGCQACNVSNCLLCSPTDANQCDICSPKYTYNSDTKKCDPPACPQQNNIWVIDHCQCDKSKAFVNANGQCQLIDNIKKLSLALGISIPIVLISLAVVLFVNVSMGKGEGTGNGNGEKGVDQSGEKIPMESPMENRAGPSDMLK